MSDLGVTNVAGAPDDFSAEQLHKVDAIIASNREKPGALIPVLEQAQDVLGYLPPSIQTRIANGLNIPVANVYGVVTFYSFFTMTPKGKHTIRVCLGTACYVKGSQKILDGICAKLGVEPGCCTPDKRFSVESVRCVGTCGLAPVLVVNEDTHGQVKVSDLDGILASYN